MCLSVWSINLRLLGHVGQGPIAIMKSECESLGARGVLRGDGDCDDGDGGDDAAADFDDDDDDDDGDDDALCHHWGVVFSK